MPPLSREELLSLAGNVIAKTRALLPHVISPAEVEDEDGDIEQEMTVRHWIALLLIHHEPSPSLQKILLNWRLDFSAPDELADPTERLIFIEELNKGKATTTLKLIEHLDNCPRREHGPAFISDTEAKKEELESLALTAAKVRAAAHSELCATILTLLMEASEDTSISVEHVSVASAGHSFILLGRDQTSTLDWWDAEGRRWGENALIIDPRNNQAYFVSDALAAPDAYTGFKTMIKGKGLDCASHMHLGCGHSRDWKEKSMEDLGKTTFYSADKIKGYENFPPPVSTHQITAPSAVLGA